MNEPGGINANAWLESPEGVTAPITGICSLGRSKSNQIILRDSKASRRHAMIHPQEGGQYWLVDFGSTNGTMVNGRRLMSPQRLQDRDQIGICGESFVFRNSASARKETDFFDTVSDMVTAREIKSQDCWLLVADVMGATRLSNNCAPEEFTVLLGRWFLSCKETIDNYGGQMNKVLGDGFFAYWNDHLTAGPQVAKALEQLNTAQATTQPPFRWVLHYGPVSVGGSTSLGEESLLGPAVNFVFRMEKLAGSLAVTRLISDVAKEKLADGMQTDKLGPHQLSGFDGDYYFHSY